MQFEKVLSRKFLGKEKINSTYLSLPFGRAGFGTCPPEYSGEWLSRLHRACPSVFLDNNLFKERGKYKNKNEKYLQPHIRS